MRRAQPVRASAVAVAVLSTCILLLVAGCPPPTGTDSAVTTDSTVFVPACSNGIDDDFDGRVDYPTDPGCASEIDNDESDPDVLPECSDGIDNDGDMLADFGFDPDCVAAFDDLEATAQCKNGLDDDGDGLVDFPDDPGCELPGDNNEVNPPPPGECRDSVDNDGDALIDYPDDCGCTDLFDDTEADPATPPVCCDGMDNDMDGLIDFGDDPGCIAGSDPDETDVIVGLCGPSLSALDISGTGEAMGSHTGALNEAMGSCGGNGGEDVYLFTLGAVADLLITTNNPMTTLDTVLYVRTVCDDTATEVGCNDDVMMPLLSSEVLIASAAPGDYWIFVDAFGPGSLGDYHLTVDSLIPQGMPCNPMDPTQMCGPGLVCRELMPGAGTTCEEEECADTLDNDGDAIIDYPADPGCLAPDDNDETSPMPLPVCGNGLDDDGDALPDWPMDPGCTAASDPSEVDECIPGVPVLDLPAGGVVMASLAPGASLFEGSCTAGGFTPGAEDIYVFTVPGMANVTASTAGSSFDNALYVRSMCDDTLTELGCSDFGGNNETVTMPGLAPGLYFAFVDTANGGSGAYTLTISGELLQGEPCDPADMQWTCVTGTLCEDPGGGFVCNPTECNDGVDNDGDSLSDYPNDPGCMNTSDDDETSPVPLPQCANGIDDDGDGDIDFGMDTGCSSAADDDETCTLFGSNTFGYIGCEEPMVTTMPCEDLVGTGMLACSGDDCSTNVLLPFTFDYYGISRTSVSIISNGKLGFPGTTSFTNSCTIEPDTIAPFWDDLLPPGGGAIYYDFFGTSPNQHMTIQWNIPHIGGGGLYDIRAVLYENGDIDFCYLNTVTAGPSDNGLSATSGIAGAGDQLQYSCDSPVLVDDLLLRFVHP